MSENFMIVHGDKLLAGGFPFLPIMPGEKFPGRFERGKWFPYKGWTKHASRNTTVHELAIWKQWPEAGIGVPGGMVAAVDIDVTEDADLADRLQALAFQMLGKTQAVRIGQHPKRVLVYRAEVPFKGIKAHPLEVLCQGQQFVAYAIHPGTGRPYEWPVKSLSDMALADLPAISEEQSRAFIDAALLLLPEGMRPTRLEQNHPEIPESSPFSTSGTYRPGPVPIAGTCRPGTERTGTPEAVADALRYIVNANLSYDDWVRIGMAIKGALGEDGAWLFADWSASSSKNVPDTTARAWESFRPTSIGAGTLYHLAQRNGWKPDSSLVLNPANHHPGPHPAEGLLQKMQRPSPEPATDVLPFLETPGWNVTDIDGVLGLLVAFMLATATRPQPILAVGNALCALGALMGRRYRTETNLRSNLYIIGIADSGSGKNHSREVITNLLHQVGLQGHLGGNRIASGSGLLRAIYDHPAVLFQQDEFGMFLQAAADRRRQPRYITEILDLMTELYSSASTVYLGLEYAILDKKNGRKDIHQPCLCFYGTTTPITFWSALKSANVVDGSLARFLILKTKDDYPDRSSCHDSSLQAPDALLDGLRAIVENGSYGPGNLAGMTVDATTAVQPLVVFMTEEAKAFFADFGEQVNTRLRQAKNTTFSPVLARAWENAAKVALIRGVSANPFEPVIRGSDAAWAIALVCHSVNTFIEDVAHNIADNQTEQNHKRVLEIIRNAGPKGISKRDLTRRTQFLDQRQRQDILQSLIDGGQILVETRPTRTIPVTVYRVA
ncbi:MAG: PriCT-2 domain-containing protein [Magnetococcales bacterium]|nr:PriCT-2 domain-containing protein [Magnetococcales bacterium]